MPILTWPIAGYGKFMLQLSLCIAFEDKGKDFCFGKHGVLNLLHALPVGNNENSKIKY